MMLTQEYAQSFLSLAFGMDKAFIVPKQGNWFNPQDSGLEGFKVDTWCAYSISNPTNRTLAFYDTLSDGSGNVSTTIMKSTIDVQLVGKLAEYGALSMAHWTHRGDLESSLELDGMALLPDGLGDYIVSDFAQDGFNTVLAYNSSFDVLWLSQIDTSQEPLVTVNLPSGITQIISSGILTIIH